MWLKGNLSSCTDRFSELGQAVNWIAAGIVSHQVWAFGRSNWDVIQGRGTKEQSKQGGQPMFGLTALFATICECTIKKTQIRRVVLEEAHPHGGNHCSLAQYFRYELTDPSGPKRRELSDLPGARSMVLVLSRGGFLPDRIIGAGDGLVQLHHEPMKSVTPQGSSPSVPTNMILTNEYRRRALWAHWTFYVPGAKRSEGYSDIRKYKGTPRTIR